MISRHESVSFSYLRMNPLLTSPGWDSTPCGALLSVRYTQAVTVKLRSVRIAGASVAA
jgi:hypothetical protein